MGANHFVLLSNEADVLREAESLSSDDLLDRLQ